MISEFLVEVLGPDGASALIKATERSQELGNALLPRSVLAWINTHSDQFQGELPGTNTAVAFSKSEEGYSGYVGVGTDMYRFTNATLFHVAASVSVALGAAGEGVAAARGLHLENLGRSIDLLAKSQKLHKELDKKKAAEELEKSKDKPAEGAPGPSHAPTKPDAPLPPTKVAPPIPNPQPKPTRPKIPRPAKPVAGHTLKLTRSEADSTCELCGIGQFTNEQFTACHCLRVLAKSVKVLAFEPVSVTLELGGEDWDLEARTTLLQIVGRK